MCLHVCGCMQMCLYMNDVLCIRMACGGLGNCSSKLCIWFCFLFVCLPQALWLTWRLTKLSRLGGQQDPQINLSLPPQHLDDQCMKECPAVSQD